MTEQESVDESLKELRELYRGMRAPPQIFDQLRRRYVEREDQRSRWRIALPLGGAVATVFFGWLIAAEIFVAPMPMVAQEELQQTPADAAVESDNSVGASVEATRPSSAVDSDANDGFEGQVSLPRSLTTPKQFVSFSQLPVAYGAPKMPSMPKFRMPAVGLTTPRL